MAPRLIFRVENADGSGPFAGQCDIRTELTLWAMPTPDDDGIYELSDHEFCGLSTLAKVDQWLPEPDRARLHFRGFAVHAFMVPAGLVRDGKEQLVFARQHHAVIRLGCLNPHSLELL